MPLPLARVSQVQVPDEEILGEAMLAITPAQRGYVIALLETGGQNETEAARRAGFGGTEGATRAAAYRLARNPSILAAIREEADRRLKHGGILGASVMVEIARDPMHKDRFKAADRLLAQAGLGVEQTHRVIHEDNRTDAELNRAIMALALRHGLDPKKLLGQDVVDAEFTEVVPSAEGLEDLL